MVNKVTSFVSDAAADKLLLERTTVDFLTRKGGLKLTKGMTQEEKRAAIRQAVENVVHKEKPASIKKAGEYRAVKPRNVELPTVPIIEISLDEVAQLNGGVLPQYGGYVRDTVIERAKVRLGLDKREAAYIPASNISRSGEEYILRVTKSTLNKMFSPSDGGPVPVETAAIVEHLEQIANNAVWYDGEGDRKGRDQIRGIDHLMTTVYIDGSPTVVDMTVRIIQQSEKADSFNFFYYVEPQSIKIAK